MTQSIPAPAGLTGAEFGAAAVQPTNAVPGFAVPPGGPSAAVPPAQPPSAPTAPAAPSTGTSPDMAAAIAALTAALGAAKAPETPDGEVGTSPAPEKFGDLNTLDTSTLDDPIIRSMATVMQTVGKDLDLNRAIGNALDRGDARLIDTAYLREKGGANAEQLITIAKGIVEAVEAKGNAITAEIHALAGGEAGWTASVAAFNSTAPQELRLVVAQMLDSNKPDIIKAGAKLVTQFGNGSGLIPNSNPQLTAGAGANAAAALTKEGFQAELRKLDPNSREFNTQRSELFARRALGRKLGK